MEHCPEQKKVIVYLQTQWPQFGNAPPRKALSGVQGFQNWGLGVSGAMTNKPNWVQPAVVDRDRYEDQWGFHWRHRVCCLCGPAIGGAFSNLGAEKSDVLDISADQSGREDLQEIPNLELGDLIQELALFVLPDTVYNVPHVTRKAWSATSSQHMACNRWLDCVQLLWRWEPGHLFDLSGSFGSGTCPCWSSSKRRRFCTTTGSKACKEGRLLWVLCLRRTQFRCSTLWLLERTTRSALPRAQRTYLNKPAVPDWSTGAPWDWVLGQLDSQDH